MNWESIIAAASWSVLLLIYLMFRAFASRRSSRGFGVPAVRVANAEAYDHDT